MADKPYGYLIGWPAANKWYIGVRYAKDCSRNDLWVTYFTSSKEVFATRALLGEPTVVRVIREFDSAAAATKWETRVLRRLKAARSPLWLNLSNGGGEFLNVTDRARERLRQSWTAERKAAAKDYRPGYKHSAETREKMSIAASTRPSSNKGKTLSDAHKASLSRANKGKTASDESRRKMSASRLGRKQTPEHTANRVASKLALAAQRKMQNASN